VRGPDVRAGVRSDAQVYLRDLYPTTCEAAGVTPPSSIEGRSFWPILEGRAQEGYPFVVGYFRDTQRMIRTDRWKLVEYPQVQRTQFFDLATDPDELHDLSNDPAQEPTIAKLHEQLHTWLREHGDPLEAR
jgi:arylsulfatase A-like enzyme